MTWAQKLDKITEVFVVISGTSTGLPKERLKLGHHSILPHPFNYVIH
jgi:hypothetical protein